MLKQLSALLGNGGSNVSSELRDSLVELQGLSIAVVAGAAAGTSMSVAAIRTEDTLVAAVVTTDAGGPLVNDIANITLNDVRANGTVTVLAVADADTVTVNNVVYTFKDVPTVSTHVRRVAGNNGLNASRLASAINANETRRTGGGFRGATVIASVVGVVVTVFAVLEGVAGNAFTFLSSNGTRLAVTGAGTLTSGSAAGGFKSTTNLTGKSVILVYFNKK